MAVVAPGTLASAAGRRCRYSKLDLEAAELRRSRMQSLVSRHKLLIILDSAGSRARDGLKSARYKVKKSLRDSFGCKLPNVGGDRRLGKGGLLLRKLVISLGGLACMSRTVAVNRPSAAAAARSCAVGKPGGHARQAP